MAEEKDHDCPAMVKISVTASWCSRSQYREFCGNCKWLERPAREISYYQTEKRKAKNETNGH